MLFKNVVLVRGVRKSRALGVRPRLKSNKLCERVYKVVSGGPANIWNLQPNRQFPLDIAISLPYRWLLLEICDVATNPMIF